MGVQLQLRSFIEGEELPESLRERAQELFRKEYFNYHYLEAVGALERVRLLALFSGAVVGYASFKIVGAYAHCANLLVSSTHRGRGIGLFLETSRYELVRRYGKKMYVSCTCEDLASQRLKLRLGLTPVNIKYGFRQDIMHEGHVGSAVVFSEGAFPITAPSPHRVSTCEDLQRVRVLKSEDHPVEHACCPGEDWFAEVLTGGTDAVSMVANSEYTYSGIECDLEPGVWHHCFQLKNSRYWSGIQGAPKLAIHPSTLQQFLTTDTLMGVGAL